MHDSPRYRDSAAKCLSAVNKHVNLITAHFISLWPSHGIRSPVGMRQ
jgi:hypothetical protein